MVLQGIADLGCRLVGESWVGGPACGEDYDAMRDGTHDLAETDFGVPSTDGGEVLWLVEGLELGLGFGFLSSRRLGVDVSGGDCE